MEEDKCIICYEAMSVPVYRVVEQTTVEGDCTRLVCGHALHTTCMIDSLQSTRGKCSLCNWISRDSELSYQQRMRYETECSRLLESVKKDALVKESMADYRAFRKELSTKRAEYKKRMKEQSKLIREELGIERVLKDYKQSKRTAVSNFKQVVKRRGGLFSIALKNLGGCSTERLLFGRNCRYDYFRNRFFYRF